MSEDTQTEQCEAGGIPVKKDFTFGEKAVGLSFNPAGDEKVQRVKELFAQVIDLCNDLRADLKNQEELYPGQSADKARLFSVAITEAQGAQMWAVKAITWK